jgi:thiaminase/transcriptional activator TenA
VSDEPGPFCTWLWDTSKPIYDAILAHPFLSGLTDGTLGRSAFAFYVAQDAHYLRGYARALSLVSAKAHDATEIALFATHAAQAVEVERSLHEELLGALGLDPSEIDRTEIAPTTAAYVDHLIASCATGSYADAIAAVLPCYWIYAEVGRTLSVVGSPDPAFSRWIDTYGGDEFAVVVRAVLEVAERIGSGLGGEDRARAADLYFRSSRYEWLFWDAAYREQTWPTWYPGG